MKDMTLFGVNNQEVGVIRRLCEANTLKGVSEETGLSTSTIWNISSKGTKCKVRKSTKQRLTKYLKRSGVNKILGSDRPEGAKKNISANEDSVLSLLSKAVKESLEKDQDHEAVIGILESINSKVDRLCKHLGAC